MVSEERNRAKHSSPTINLVYLAPAMQYASRIQRMSNFPTCTQPQCGMIRLFSPSSPSPRRSSLPDSPSQPTSPPSWISLHAYTPASSCIGGLASGSPSVQSRTRQHQQHRPQTRIAAVFWQGWASVSPTSFRFEWGLMEDRFKMRCAVFRWLQPGV